MGSFPMESFKHNWNCISKRRFTQSIQLIGNLQFDKAFLQTADFISRVSFSIHQRLEIPSVHYAWIINIRNYENWLKGVEALESLLNSFSQSLLLLLSLEWKTFFHSSLRISFFIGYFYDSFSSTKCKWDERFFWSAFLAALASCGERVEGLQHKQFSQVLLWLLFFSLLWKYVLNSFSSSVPASTEKILSLFARQWPIK